MGLSEELSNWLKVGQPAVWLASRDELYAIELLDEVSATLAPEREHFIWTASEGLVDEEGEPWPDTRSLAAALTLVRGRSRRSLLTLIDPDLTEATNARHLRDLLAPAVTPMFTHHREGQSEVSHTVVVVAQRMAVHPSLERLFVRLVVPPPTEEALGRSLQSALEQVKRGGGSPECPPSDRPALLRAAAGLTYAEAGRLFQRLLWLHGALGEAQLPLVQQEKCRLAAEHPLIQLEGSTVQLEELGGMQTYKDWVSRRSRAASGLGSPGMRGALLVGLPGCGQSVAVKAAAQAWGLPLLRLDAAVVGLPGGTDRREVEEALDRLEAAGPLVLWIFRLEQAFVRLGEEGGRAATPGALVLEQWLLSRGRKTLVMATAAEPERLPMDVVVRGCFDDIFFLDFPNSEERRQILRLALARRGLRPEDLNLEMLVAASDGFSGAQISQAIGRAMMEGLDHGRPLKMLDLLSSLRQTTPMAAHLGEHRRRLRTWAHRRATSVSPHREG